MTDRAHRLTWSWVWTIAAVGLLGLAAAIITAVAIAGNDRDSVVLAVLLIGFPAVLAAFALGTLAVVMARPSGARWRAGRRWALAFTGLLLVVAGAALLGQDTQAAVLFILAGLSALSFLVMDVRRGRSGE